MVIVKVKGLLESVDSRLLLPSFPSILKGVDTMSNNKISKLVPRNQKVFVAFLIMLSAIDSVVSNHFTNSTIPLADVTVARGL